MELILFETALGQLGLCGEGDEITRLYLPGQPVPQIAVEETPVLAEGRRQLLEYLAGERREFDLPLAPAGTPFQRLVWEALQTIPWGKTRSYGEIARQIGRPKACRAVGMANHHNPIPILIPCHRVVGADGSLTGYAGGVELKEALLRLEQARS